MSDSFSTITLTGVAARQTDTSVATATFYVNAPLPVQGTTCTMEVQTAVVAEQGATTAQTNVIYLLSLSWSQPYSVQYWNAQTTGKDPTHYQPNGFVAAIPFSGAIQNVVIPQGPHPLTVTIERADKTAHAGTQLQFYLQCTLRPVKLLLPK